MVDQNAVDTLERTLELRLPLVYKHLLREYPFERGSFVDEFLLYGNITEVLELNLAIRVDGFFGQPWPPHYLVIGQDGSGNMIFLDLGQPPSPVFEADHETTAHDDYLAKIEVAPSLAAWIESLKKDQEERDAEERVRTERRKNKSWWQWWI